MTDLKLADCPFCGNAPRYLAAKQGFYSERVICDHCHFYLPPHLWNARSALQHQEEREPEALRPSMSMFASAADYNAAMDEWCSTRQQSLDAAIATRQGEEPSV